MPVGACGHLPAAGLRQPQPRSGAGARCAGARARLAVRRPGGGGGGHRRAGDRRAAHLCLPHRPRSGGSGLGARHGAGRAAGHGVRAAAHLGRPGGCVLHRLSGQHLDRLAQLRPVSRGASRAAPPRAGRRGLSLRREESGANPDRLWAILERCGAPGSEMRGRRARHPGHHAGQQENQKLGVGFQADVLEQALEPPDGKRIGNEGDGQAEHGAGRDGKGRVGDATIIGNAFAPGCVRL
ncbi:hypothetical protein THIX_10655 [Thiomonas sp. X19]|nr:hypothetical protein THIX_10655 [Thiomonas sp. X19]